MVKTAWLPEQVEAAHPGLVEVIFVVLTVAQSMFSFQLMVTLLFKVTPVAPPVGMVELTEGAAVSTVTVTGGKNSGETFPAASFAHG